ncbi:hypothetical protein BH23ACT9_BH23ACT9_33630 [soil metagenome]
MAPPRPTTDPAGRVQRPPAPGWERLWRHSYRLGAAWVIREARRGWPYPRTGLARLLVPMDPWRYYELGRVADADLGGRCLDVSSPKLLASLLQAEGKGDWVCIDLYDREIQAWRRVDPALELDVADATDLPYADDAFDHVVCISVLEHVGRHAGQDAAALGEMFRVLAPGGVLHLTTDVAPVGADVFVEDRVYGSASVRHGDHGVFFKHDYAPAEIDTLLDDRPWETVLREYAVQRDPQVERRFYARAPWSYAYGPLLRFTVPRNFEVSASPDVLRAGAQGVTSLQLRKHAHARGNGK